MNGIRFSIVITCHNQASFIAEAVDSALAQPCEAKEVVVVDDASSDASPEILKAYSERIRFAALQTNQGANTSRNLGAAMSTGEYLVFLDGDDVLLPWALDVYETVIALRKPKIILSRMKWFDTLSPAVRNEQPPRDVHFVEYQFLVDKNRNYQPGASAMVIAREAFRAVNGWTDELFCVEDVDLMLKLGSSGPALQILAPETKGYRIHSANTRHRIPKMVEGLYKVIARENAGVYPGGRKLRFGRYVIIGAPVFFWFKSAYRAKLFGTAAKVFARGWRMFAAAGVRRLITALGGRSGPQALPLVQKSNDKPRLAQPLA